MKYLNLWENVFHFRDETPKMIPGEFVTEVLIQPGNETIWLFEISLSICIRFSHLLREHSEHEMTEKMCLVAEERPTFSPEDSTL